MKMSRAARVSAQAERQREEDGVPRGHVGRRDPAPISASGVSFGTGEVGRERGSAEGAEVEVDHHVLADARAARRPAAAAVELDRVPLAVAHAQRMDVEPVALARSRRSWRSPCRRSAARPPSGCVMRGKVGTGGGLSSHGTGRPSRNGARPRARDGGTRSPMPGSRAGQHARAREERHVGHLAEERAGAPAPAPAAGRAGRAPARASRRTPRSGTGCGEVRLTGPASESVMSA